MKHKKINPLIENRYSPRAYSREPLSEEIIESLFEAARWAASARNAQPWRFIFATPDRKETWDKLVECLTPTNQEWARDAPFLMLALVQKTDPERNSERKSALYDLGLAMGNFSFKPGIWDSICGIWVVFRPKKPANCLSSRSCTNPWLWLQPVIGATKANCPNILPSLPLKTEHANPWINSYLPVIGRKCFEFLL